VSAVQASVPELPLTGQELLLSAGGRGIGLAIATRAAKAGRQHRIYRQNRILAEISANVSAQAMNATLRRE
jgi:hypothetical protein